MRHSSTRTRKTHTAVPCRSENDSEYVKRNVYTDILKIRDGPNL